MDIMFVCKYDSEEELTMEQFLDPNAYNEDMLNRMYKNELFLDAVKSWMPFLYKRGFLDTVDGENDDDPKSLNDIVGKAANDKLKENGEVVEEWKMETSHINFGDFKFIDFKFVIYLINK